MTKGREAIHHSRRLQVLGFVRERGETSRVDIARELHLDKRIVSAVVDELLRSALLIPAGFRESRAGRRQELLCIHGGHSNYVGIDLGATHIIGLLTDLNAGVLDRISFGIRPGLPVELILDQMRSIAARLAASEKRTADVGAAGIGVPGFVDPETGASLMAENIPGWREIHIRAGFEELLRCPVYIDDCSRAFGRAEKWAGAGRRESDFLVLDLGYGIGLAVFVDGRPYMGSGYKSGEIGHVVARPDGTECTCGKRGCLETVASGQGIARLAALGIREGRSTVLAGLTQGRTDSVTAQDVAIAASLQDDFSIGLLREAGAFIGVALANAVTLLNPARVIVGGGLVGAGRFLLDSLQAELNRCTMRGIREDLRFQVSTLGVDGSALGGALLAMAPVFEPAANTRSNAKEDTG